MPNENILFLIGTKRIMHVLREDIESIYPTGKIRMSFERATNDFDYRATCHNILVCLWAKISKIHQGKCTRYICIAVSFSSHLNAEIQDFIAFSFVLNLIWAKFLFKQIFHFTQSEYLQSYTRFKSLVAFFSVIYFDSTRSDLLQNCKIPHLNEARCNRKCALVRWPCFHVSHFHLLRASFGFLLYLQKLHLRHFSKCDSFIGVKFQF